MKINVKMLTEEAYATMQKNYMDIYQNIKDHPSDSTWLKSYLGFEPYEIKKYEIEDFNLNELKNENEIVFEVSKLLYENLCHLPRYILCNCRFWAWIKFEKAYQFAQTKTSIESAEQIKSLWLGTDARRSLMLGVVSRNYFMIELSIDDRKSDKYELSKLLHSSSMEIYRNIAYRNIFMLKNVALSFLEAWKIALQEYNDVITRPQIRDIMIEVYKIGSVYLIDIMDEEDLKNIFVIKIYRVLGII